MQLKKSAAVAANMRQSCSDVAEWPKEMLIQVCILFAFLAHNKYTNRIWSSLKSTNASQPPQISRPSKKHFFLHLLHLVNWLLASLPLLVSFFVSFSYDKAMGVTNAREKTAKAAAALHPFQLSRRLIIFSSYYKCVKNLLFCHFPHCCSVFGLVARSSRIFCWQSSCRQWSTQLQPSSISCTYICTVSTDPLSKMEWKQNKSNVWVICEGFVCANTVLKKCMNQKIR